MNWLIVGLIGTLIGALTGIVSRNVLHKVRVPMALCLVLGAMGALLGGVLAKIAPFTIFGEWNFFVFGSLIAIGLLAGGLLDYYLTGTEERV